MRLVGIGLTFIVGVQLARALGPEAYGVYGSVMAVIAIAAVPAQAGLPQLMTREMAISREREALGRLKRFLLWAWAIVAVVALLEVGIGGAIALHLPQWTGGASEALLYGLPLIPLFALTNMGLGVVRGLSLVVWAQFYDVLLRPLLFAGLLLAYREGLGVEGALGLQVAAAAVTLIACLMHLARVVPGALRQAPEAPLDLSFARGAAAIGGTEVLRVLDGQYAVLLLGALASMGEVGVFRAGLGLAGFVALPYALVNLVVMPDLARAHGEGNGARLRLLSSASVVVIFGATAAGIGALFLLGEEGIAFVLGEGFRPAFGLMMGISVAYLVRAAFGPAAMLLNMCGGERRVTSGYALGLLAGAVVIVGLHPVLGAAAAPLGLGAAEVVRGAWWWWSARALLGVDVSILAIPVAVRSLLSR